MLGTHHIGLEQCSTAQRAAVRKLESVYGGQAVTVTDNGPCKHALAAINPNGGRVVTVLFDTGPRRTDFRSMQVDCMGWNVTTDEPILNWHDSTYGVDGLAA